MFWIWIIMKPNLGEICMCVILPVYVWPKCTQKQKCSSPEVSHITCLLSLANKLNGEYHKCFILIKLKTGILALNMWIALHWLCEWLQDTFVPDPHNLTTRPRGSTVAWFGVFCLMWSQSDVFFPLPQGWSALTLALRHTHLVLRLSVSSAS